MGTLYVVATPIGNLADFSSRAVSVLNECIVIAAEDTRHSRKLLQAHGIDTRKLIAYHQHNEKSRSGQLLDHLREGDIALISDAGTPGLSDPGLVLVREAQRRGCRVSPIPGASAVTAAVAVSGLVTRGFRFLGFLDSRREARRRQLESLRHDPMPTVLFEAPHRILPCLSDLVEVLEPTRAMVLCRELTKLHEEVICGTVAEVFQRLSRDSNSRRGELVLVVGAAQERPAGPDGDGLLRILLDELPLKQAVRVVARVTGQPRNDVYDRALQLKAGNAGEFEA